VCTLTQQISLASPSCLKFLTGGVAMLRRVDGPRISSIVRNAFLFAISSVLLLGSVGLRQAPCGPGPLVVGKLLPTFIHNSPFTIPFPQPLFRLVPPESRILTPIAYHTSLSRSACQET